MLSRYAGMRCPSEVLSLKLTDIDWAGDKLTITSPKTEHHPGKETRVIPLFPELREELLAASEAAPDCSVYVVNEKFRKGSMGKVGWRNCNLRTTFEKIIRRAGLTPWTRLFHNLRSSRETELLEKYPIQVVSAWMGHTPDIALKHYAETTEEHFRNAVQPADSDQDEVLQKCMRNCMRNTAEQSGAALSEQAASIENPGNTRVCSGVCPSPQEYNADGEGFEPPVDLRPLQFSRLPQ